MLSSTKKKIYNDANEAVGEEDDIDVQILLRDNLTQELIDSVLRSSPAAATMNHLQRLAMHKRLGSSDQDRGVRLHDCAIALRPYSDVVVYLACKAFWETSKKEFFPQIGEIAAVCEILQRYFTELRSRMIGLMPPKPSPRTREEESDLGKRRRREVCDFLIDKGEEDYYERITNSNYFLETMARAKYGWKSGN